MEAYLEDNRPTLNEICEEYDECTKECSGYEFCHSKTDCEDAISRKAVLDYIYNDLGLGDEENGKDVERQMELESSYRYVKTLPSITPQSKTGHWVEENINEWSHKVFCSECGCMPPFEHVSNGDVYSSSGYGVINKTK